MTSEDGVGPGWGSSFGRFGSDSSADPAAAGSSRQRSVSKRSGVPAASASSSGARRSGAGARKARGGRVSARVSFDDPFGPVVGASADAAREDGFPDQAAERSGQRDDADGVEKPRSDEEWESLARSILLRQLALGPRSRHQLDRKLADRDVPPAVVTALLDRFEEVQLIDDAEFARMWVRTRTAVKSLSRASMRRELADKGIEAELAEDALLQISDEDERLLARDVVRRKLRGSADLSLRAERDREVRRLVGVLARKGYSTGAAFSIVKDVLAEAGTDE